MFAYNYYICSLTIIGFLEGVRTPSLPMRRYIYQASFAEIPCPPTILQLWIWFTWGVAAQIALPLFEGTYSRPLWKTVYVRLQLWYMFAYSDWVARGLAALITCIPAYLCAVCFALRKGMYPMYIFTFIIIVGGHRLSSREACWQVMYKYVHFYVQCASRSTKVCIHLFIGVSLWNSVLICECIYQLEHVCPQTHHTWK